MRIVFEDGGGVGVEAVTNTVGGSGGATCGGFGAGGALVFVGLEESHLVFEE